MSGKIDLSGIVTPMQDVQAHLRALFFGAAGSGKTTSALGVALGLTVSERHPEGDATRIVCLDTERGSAAKAGRDMGASFQHAPLEAFARYATVGRREPQLVENDPRVYAVAIPALAEHYDVLVIDSLTHAWEACMVLLDEVAQKGFGGNTQAAWSVITPWWQAIIGAILNAPCHVIATARAKIEYEQVQRSGNKSSTLRAIGLKPELRKGVEYEVDVVAHMSAEHDAHIIKARSTQFMDQIVPKPGVELGKALAAWLSGGAEDTATWLSREMKGAGLTVEALDAWRASIGKGPVSKLTDPQVRQVVGYVMSRDEVKAAVKGFMGDAAQGAEG